MNLVSHYMTTNTYAYMMFMSITHTQQPWWGIGTNLGLVGGGQ
jgi:hypothetical protein